MSHQSIYFNPVNENSHIFISGKQFNYIKNVLRLKGKEHIDILDGEGKRFEAEIVRVDKNKKNVHVRVLKILEASKRRKAYIRLFCAIPKRENFFYIVQKTTELGVAGITPIVTDYQQKKPGDINRFMDRVRSVSAEALEQSGQLFLPVIGDVMKFKDAVDSVSGKKILVFTPSAGKSFKTLCMEMEQEERINIFVGPEGGFSRGELAYSSERGAEVVSIEEFNVLRTETAASVITGILIFYLSKKDF